MRSLKQRGAVASLSLPSEVTALWQASRRHSPQATAPCRWPVPSSESPNSCFASGQRQLLLLPLQLQQSVRLVWSPALTC